MIDVPRGDFESQGWTVHAWNYANQHVTVLQREPFRMKWIATKLVTYVFLIHRTPKDYLSVLSDYPALRQFAGDHKQTWLPFGVQCGYALLPIYIGRGFPEYLIGDIRTTYRKRWCVLHVPSLFDLDSGQAFTLQAKSLWGCVYRNFIEDSIAQTTHALAPAAT